MNQFGSNRLRRVDSEAGPSTATANRPLPSSGAVLQGVIPSLDKSDRIASRMPPPPPPCHRQGGGILVMPSLTPPFDVLPPRLSQPSFASNVSSSREPPSFSLNVSPSREPSSFVSNDRSLREPPSFPQNDNSGRDAPLFPPNVSLSTKPPSLFAPNINPSRGSPLVTQNVNSSREPRLFAPNINQLSGHPSIASNDNPPRVPPSFLPNINPPSGPPLFAPNVSTPREPPSFVPDINPSGGPPSFAPNVNTPREPPSFAPNADPPRGPPAFVPNVNPPSRSISFVPNVNPPSGSISFAPNVNPTIGTPLFATRNVLPTKMSSNPCSTNEAPRMALPVLPHNVDLLPPRHIPPPTSLGVFPSKSSSPFATSSALTPRMNAPTVSPYNTPQSLPSVSKYSSFCGDLSPCSYTAQLPPPSTIGPPLYTVVSSQENLRAESNNFTQLPPPNMTHVIVNRSYSESNTNSHAESQCRNDNESPIYRHPPPSVNVRNSNMSSVSHIQHPPPGVQSVSGPPPLSAHKSDNNLLSLSTPPASTLESKSSCFASEEKGKWNITAGSVTTEKRSNLEDNDKRWISWWLGRRPCDPDCVQPRRMSLREYTNLIRTAGSLISELKENHRTLKQRIDLTESEWIKATETITKLKLNLETVLENLKKNQDNVQSLLKVRQKRRKREREKRKRMKVSKAEEIKIILKKHAEIDIWRDNYKEEHNRKKREEDVRREADQIMGQVRTKLSDARRMVTLIPALRRLRQLRQDKAEQRGQYTTHQSDVDFTKVTENLKHILELHLKNYECEEQTLKVMMAAESEDRVKIEHHGKKKGTTQKSLAKGSGVSNVDEVLFGRVPDPSDPIYSFFLHYTAAERDPSTLCKVRQDWDCFLSPNGQEGSAVPPVWVVPSPPTSPEWKTALVQSDGPLNLNA